MITWSPTGSLNRKTLGAGPRLHVLHLSILIDPARGGDQVHDPFDPVPPVKGPRVLLGGNHIHDGPLVVDGFGPIELVHAVNGHHIAEPRRSAHVHNAGDARPLEFAA